MSGLAVALFALALWFYNNMQPELGILLLDLAFAVPMVWAVLAARDANDPETPLRRFVLRIGAWLALGAGMLGTFWWSVDRRISVMEAMFGVFYIAMAFATIRVIAAKDKGRPHLTAISGGNIPTRQRQRRRSR
jgi:hypothetical protein